jgi:uncharacterized protein YlxW (UPF0749 family)
VSASGPDRRSERGGEAFTSPDFLLDLFRNPLDPGYADAAARKAGKPPPARRRGARLLTVTALVAIGALLAVAYQQVVQDEPTRAQARADLVDRVHEQSATTAALEQRLEDLRDDVARLRDQQLAGSQARRLRDLEAATGVARVQGDGVVVQVADGPEQQDPMTGGQVAEARILDYDLQRIANTLWAAGAEAIAINDRRLTATSTIRNASGAILVNRVPVAGPYEVTAVGPDDLAERFAASTTALYLQELVNTYGISYELRPETNLTLPAAPELDLHHAAPAGASATSGGDR